MDEASVRAEKHIEAEESNEGKKDKEFGKQVTMAERAEPQHAQPIQKRDRGDRGSRNRNKTARPSTEDRYTPLNAKPPTILDISLNNGTMRRPAPFVRTMGRNPDSNCRYHRIGGHTTYDCWTLKQQIEQLIQRGHLKKFVKEGKTGDGKR